MEFCSPQYGQTTDPTVSAVPSPRGNSSSRSSKKSIIEQGSQMSMRQLRTVTWKVNLALDGVATCRSIAKQVCEGARHINCAGSGPLRECDRVARENWI